MNSSNDYRGIRVVHAANYQLEKDGLVFSNCDIKMGQGLIQNGCYVYPFSINDRARMLSFLGSKTWGKGKANRALIQTCVNVAPDVLVLGHAQYITRDTLLEIRRLLPDIKIALWYVVGRMNTPADQLIRFVEERDFTAKPVTVEERGE